MAQQVAWAPQAGSQVQFLTCPLFEALFHGNRGGGKTDCLLMDFAQHVGVGYGAEWRGVLFRQTFPQLQDVINKSKKWFKLIWGDRAVYNEGQHFWKWSTGEVLYFRQFMRESDYWNYHGHAYPWIGWEELCNWADLGGYKRMMSCCRSTEKGIPKKIRATTNPYGPGHNVVKFRFRLPGSNGQVILDALDDEQQLEPPRVAIQSSLSENKILLDADPGYLQRVLASARNDAERRAWRDGSWDIVAGGMFDDVWDARYNVVPYFEPPRQWRLDRSFDWGSSKPFSVGWWTQSDGGDLLLPNNRVISTVRGDLFRLREWYGWNGKPNEGKRMLASDVAKGIVEREKKWGWDGRVVAGPADTSIFDVENGVSIALDMARPTNIEGGMKHQGVSWLRADKRPGSRKTGWEMLRKYMNAVRGELAPGQSAPDGRRLPREHPGIFVSTACEHFLRTVPVLPRDDKDMDDVDTDAEDHVADEVRYRIRSVGSTAGSGRTVGVL